MRKNTSVLGYMLGGWMLIILSALMLALAAAFVQHKYGLGKDGARIMVRISASLSMILFMCLFISNALNTYWQGTVSDWISDNRRYLGLSFAASHIIHGGFLLSLYRYGTDYFMSVVRWDTIILGGLAYIVIFMMVITSLWPSVMQRNSWLKPVYFYGMYYIWLIFFATFAERAWDKPATYLPYALITITALWFNIKAVRNKKA